MHLLPIHGIPSQQGLVSLQPTPPGGTHRGVGVGARQLIF